MTGKGELIVAIMVIHFSTSSAYVHHDEIAGRFWIESLSSTRGWSIRAGKCQSGEKFLGQHEYPIHKTNCNASTDFIHRGWTMSNFNKSTTENYKNEGITLSVLNQRKGNLVLHKIFPLGRYWAHWADLQWHINHIAPGRIVIMTVSVSGAYGLRQAAKTLNELGSVLAQHLTPNALWIWVFIKGGRTIAEAGVLHSLASTYIHTQLQFNDLPARYQTTNNLLEQTRWYYCENEGGMGALCDENFPSLLPLPTPPKLSMEASAALSKVPVILSAGRRHQYLYHTLTTLLAAPGAQLDNILVVLGHAPKSTTTLLDILKVKYTSILLQGQTNSDLFWYYRRVYQLINDTFTDAPAVIILDEDVEVSPDFFSFMSQTLWLLHKDPTLYCINGFSPISGQRLTHDMTKVLRGSVQVEWGYAITLNFVREALVQWKVSTQTTTNLYDFWIYLNVRKKRECIFPERSRTKHFGIGVNTNAYLQEIANFNIQLLQEAQVPLRDVEGLISTTWRYRLSLKIQYASPIVKEPCDPDFLPKIPSNPNYVFYYRLDTLSYGLPDYYQYFQPNECLGLWSVSEQGHHEGVTTIHFAPNATLYLVGVPFSSYSYLKPDNIPLFDVDALTDEKFDFMKNRTQEYTKMDIANTNTTTNTVLQELMIKDDN